MNQLVIGCGEVGSAVAELLGSDKCDVNVSPPSSSYSVLHICYPFSNAFVQSVWEYRWKYLADLVVIHSTVPVGTSKDCGAVHSPVRGKHPNLLEGLRTFVKYFGGLRAKEAAALFSDKCPTYCVPDSNTTEALKIWDTTIYGVNIALEKEIHRWCKANCVDFRVVYEHACRTYNDGYRNLGHPEFSKYVLQHSDGKIGGHCVGANVRFLDGWVRKAIEEAA